MPILTGLARPSLADRVVDHIRKNIAAGQIVDRLPGERELAIQLNVSRSTLRAALDRLEVENVITRKQGRGTSVSRTDAIA